jgi:nuclear transport factor 2 (NTF2) superfamily protein
MSKSRPPLPPFSFESAVQKVRQAEDASRETISMNAPHKFGMEFGSDNAPEHSAAIVSHNDCIQWFEAIHG